MLLILSVAGYHYTVPMLKAAGWILENETVWKICGAPVFAVATFVVAAALTGPFLLLIDIRKSGRAVLPEKPIVRETEPTLSLLTQLIARSGDVIRRGKLSRLPCPAPADARSAGSVRPSIARGAFASRGSN